MTSGLPTDDNLVAFDSREQAASLALELINSAGREICFFGPQLDPVLFDHDSVIEALSQFARRSDRTQIRFVVFDTRNNIAQSHRLLPLAQRLTSKIKIHIASRKHQSLRQMFMLIDTNAYLYCPNSDRYQGRVATDAAASVRELQQDFNDFWNHSTADINSRRLHI